MSERQFTALPKVIVAYDQNRVIGQNNGMPWPRMKADLARFRALTTGNVVIMGRSTFESLGNKPLPNRENVVLSRDESYDADGVRVFRGYEEALDAYSADQRELYVIGGGKIYQHAIKLSRVVLATEIQAQFQGDTYFPELLTTEWEEISREAHAADIDNPLDYNFVTYQSTRALADVSKARSAQNEADLRQIERDKECPFCEGRILADGRNELIEATKFWYVTNNYLPYENTDSHLLLIPRRHVEHFTDLGEESRSELMKLIATYSSDIKAGGVAFRFGDITRTGASVGHLHVHIIEPSITLPDNKKVSFKISR